tara:strand:+ start:30 stop:1775 length:1746 start_codon:yes stop_codon:yes gene_type:complete
MNLLLVAALVTGLFQESAPLVPAGVINAAQLLPDHTYLIEDHEELQSFVRQVRARFKPDAPMLVGDGTVETDLADRNLTVYGSIEGHPWLQKYAGRLPFQFEDGAVTIAGERFKGKRLSVILAMKHPESPELRAVVYASQNVQNLVGINAVFHGPTEWLVVDGTEALGQGGFPVTLSRVERQLADLDHVLNKLAAVHPRTVKGLPPEVRKRAEVARGAFAKPLGDLEVWSHLAAVLAAMGDGHTGLRLPGTKAGLTHEFLWLGDDLVILKAPRKGDLQPADQVLSIGGLTPMQFLDRSRDWFGAENEGAARVRCLSILKSEEGLRVLDVLEDGKVAFEVQRGDERIEAWVKPGGGVFGARFGRRAQPDYDKVANLAVLPIPDLNPKHANKKAFEAFFAEVEKQGITRVALDVRENPGGHSRAILELVSMIRSKGWTSFGSVWRTSADSMEQRSYEMPLGLRSYPGARQPANPIGFAGEVFVLTSPRTYSSGAWLPVLIQDNGMGRVVGEAPGNAPSRPGDLLMFALPHSDLRMHIAFKDWIRPDPTRDPASELAPDILVRDTLEDALAGRDRVLETVRNLD